MAMAWKGAINVVVKPVRAWDNILLSNSDPNSRAINESARLVIPEIMIITAPVPNVIHHFDWTRDQLRRIESKIPAFSIITKQVLNHSLTMRNIRIGIPIKKNDSIPGTINIIRKANTTPINRIKLEKE